MEGLQFQAKSVNNYRGQSYVTDAILSTGNIAASKVDEEIRKLVVKAMKKMEQDMW